MSGNTSNVAVRADGPADKRAYVRWTFKGTAIPCRIGKKRFELRLKDLSRGGACGLMEEPVAPGDFVVIEFDDRHQVEAQVCWVRRVLVGLRFGNPLNATFVTRLHERASEEAVVAEEDYPIALRARIRSV
jgi:hypothetical protein